MQFIYNGYWRSRVTWLGCDVYALMVIDWWCVDIFDAALFDGNNIADIIHEHN